MLPLLHRQGAVFLYCSKGLSESKSTDVSVKPNVVRLCSQICSCEQALSVVKADPHFYREAMVQDKPSDVQEIVCSIEPDTTSVDWNWLITITKQSLLTTIVLHH